MTEAVQVSIPEKLQNQLPPLLKSEMNVDASVVAYGFSGWGQVPELAAFKRFGLQLHPDIVVMVIATNDLKNNSWLLEALAEGVSPDHPFYAALRPASLADPQHVSDWITIPAEENAERYRLSLPPEAPPSRPNWLSWLANNSALHGYFLFTSNYNYMAVYNSLNGGPSAKDPLQIYIRDLSENPDLGKLLAHWPLERDGRSYRDIDRAFDAKPLTGAHELAIRATEHVMDQWVDLAKQENFKIVGFLVRDFADYPGQLSAWRAILDSRGIPYIEQNQLLKAKGYNTKYEHQLRDGHWSAAGHRWAAESIAEFLKMHPSLITPVTSFSSTKPKT
jgi:hypothetical protein